MKKLYKIALLCLAAITSVTACQKAEDVFQRDTDEISVDCTAQAVTHYVLCSGAWTLETSEDWISFDPAEGVGDGVHYQAYNVIVAYNKGTARQGEYILKHSGIEAPVTVTQGKCSFAYGKAAFNGTLTQNETSTASVTVAYTGASGEETAQVSGSISGAGAAGLSIESTTYNSFTPGAGNVIIPIVGTPTNEGAITVNVTVDGNNFTVTGTVAKAVPVGPTPTEVAIAYWKFSSDGATNPTKDELAAKYPTWASGFTITDDNGAVLSIAEAAGKTASAINGAAYSNGHLYLKGLYLNDAVVIARKGVKLPAGAQITFKGCMGGSGSSAGYFLAEYSVDGSNWTECAGAQTETVNGNACKYHAKPVDNTTSDTEGAFEVKFTTAAAATDLYIRLRVSADVRLNHSSTITITTGGGGSSRFKGELSIKAVYTGEGGGSDDPVISGPVEGLPCGWNPYAAGFTSSNIPQGTDIDYSWSFGQNSNDNASLHPVGSAQPSEAHKVLPTLGNNKDAFFTCVGAEVSKYVFNPSIQACGLVTGDYWLAVIPVKNLAKDTKVTVEMGCGAAGTGPGVYVLEYSSDKTNWILADGIQKTMRGEKEVEAHLWTSAGSTSGTRKTYDKATDDTYQKYTFPLSVAIADGTLYFRLRLLDYQANPANSNAVVGGKWTDIKGFEVTLAE